MDGFILNLNTDVLFLKFFRQQLIFFYLSIRTLKIHSECNFLMLRDAEAFILHIQLFTVPFRTFYVVIQGLGSCKFLKKVIR